MIWGHTEELYYTGTGQVLRGHHKTTHQEATFYIHSYVIGHYKTEPYRCFLLLIVLQAKRYLRTLLTSRRQARLLYNPK